MKIISATCNLAETNSVQRDKYIAVVTIEDEDQRYIAREYEDDPESAIHRALSVAAAQVTDKLHKQLKIGFEVKF